MRGIAKTAIAFFDYLTAQTKCQEDKSCVQRSVESVDSRGIDRSAPIFRDFNPADHDSVEKLKNDIAKFAGDEKAIDVMVKYLRDHMESVPITWETVFDHLRIGEAFLNEPPESPLWNAGKFVEQKALEFLEKNKKTCPQDRYVCDEIYKKLTHDGKVSPHMNLLDKVAPRFKQRGAKYTLGAIAQNLKNGVVSMFSAHGEAGVGECYSMGELKLHEMSGSLPGFKLFSVMVDRKKMGMLIVGDPSEGARAGLRVKVGGKATEQGLLAKYKGGLQYQGTLTMQSQEGAIPLGTVVVEGRVHQLRFEAGRQDALILSFPDGTIRIVDKRRFRLSDITRDPKDDATFLSLTSGQAFVTGHFLEAVEKHKVTVLSTASYDPKGGTQENDFEKWGDAGGDSRLIFTFEDGKFGIFDTPSNSTNEMLAVLYRLQEMLGPLERVARCDRGMWDSAAYYPFGNEGRKVPLGQVNDDPSNRLYFYSEPKCKAK